MWQIILDGGVMMIPLVIFNIIAIAITIDRGLAFLAYRKVDTRSLRARVLELFDQGKVAEANHLCGDTPGPVSAVLMVGLRSYHRHEPLSETADELIEVMEKSMDDYSEHAVSAVEKRINVLASIGNAAPLLGMTGTVVGMIIAFDELAQTGGFEAGGKVAEGIATALITTAAGLIVALIAVLPYGFFVSMSNKVRLEIEEATTELLDFAATRLKAERKERREKEIAELNT